MDPWIAQVARRSPVLLLLLTTPPSVSFASGRDPTRGSFQTAPRLSCGFARKGAARGRRSPAASGSLGWSRWSPENRTSSARWPLFGGTPILRSAERRHSKSLDTLCPPTTWRSVPCSGGNAERQLEPQDAPSPRPVAGRSRPVPDVARSPHRIQLRRCGAAVAERMVGFDTTHLGDRGLALVWRVVSCPRMPSRRGSHSHSRCSTGRRGWGGRRR